MSAATIASVRAVAGIGMLTLRGDLSDGAFEKAAVAAGGVNLPERGRVLLEGARGLAWMSPDELLLFCPVEEVAPRLADLRDRFADRHAMAVNVTDARRVFEVAGPHARDAVAKLAPVDLHRDVFTPGMFRRTRLAQVACALWMPQDDAIRVMCFRSVGRYVPRRPAGRRTAGQRGRTGPRGGLEQAIGDL